MYCWRWAGIGEHAPFFVTTIMVIVIIIMVISIIFFLVSVKIQYILYRSLYSSSLPLDPILASPPDIIRLTEQNHSDQITTTTTTTQNHSQPLRSNHKTRNLVTSVIINHWSIEHTSTILRCWSHQNLQRLSCVWPNCNYQGWPID